MGQGAGLAVAVGAAAMLVGASLATAADDMTARRRLLEPYFRDYRPPGPGPFPALLFVSGCMGFTPRAAPLLYTDMAESWRAKGYVVVFVDYLAAQGMNRCSTTTTAEIATDVLAVASHLRTRSFVDPERISAIGWSLGGGAVLAALDAIDPGEPSPLHSVVAYYPVCTTLEPWDAKIPALVLMGANDQMARPAICQELFARLPAGTPIETRVYPDAGHGFNVPEPPPQVSYSGAATTAAAREVEQFLKR